MADKRISQLVDRGTVANNDVVPIVVSGATTTNKATISSIQTFMQENLDVGVTSVGITLGSSGTDVSVSGSPITTSGNITINIPSASATARGLVTTGTQTFAGAKTFANNILLNDFLYVREQNASTLLANYTQIYTNSTFFGFNNGAGTGSAVFTYNGSRNYTLPNASGTLALTSDIPSLAGYVTLDTAQTITAQKVFNTSGSSDSVIITHGSGSGIALDVIKAGNGEAIRVTKTSGTGNAVTITGGLLSAEAATLSGNLIGTSASFSSVVSITASPGGAGINLRGRTADDLSSILFFSNNGTTLQNYITSTPSLLSFNSQGNTAIEFRTNLAGGGGARMTIAGNGAVTLTGALNGTSASFTGAVTANATSTFSNASNLSAIFSNGGAASNYNSIELRGGTGGTAVNWQISKDNSAANSFELAASTTAGGTTYGSPVFRISSTGAATFSSSVTAGGNITSSTANYPQIVFSETTSSTNSLIFYDNVAETKNLGFRVNSDSNVMTLTSTNVGIGTSAPAAKLQISSTLNQPELIIRGSGVNVRSQLETTNDYGTWLWGVAGGDTSGDGIIYSGAAKNLKIFTADTERMRITSSGNVGIGTDSPTGYGTTLQIASGSSVDSSFVLGDGSGTTTNRYFAARPGSSGNFFFGTDTGNISFRTGLNPGTSVGTEQMRITSGGFTKASNTGTYQDSIGAYHELRTSSTNLDTVILSSTAASPYGSFILFTSASPNNTTNYFMRCADSTANRFYVYSNGNVVNTNGSYGAISDIKLKENIEDASPKLDDLMKVKVRNYNLIGDDKKQIGVIAQELEEVFPAMIDESEDFEEVEVPQLDEEGNEVLNEEGEVVTEKQRVSKGTSTKSVKYSVFVPMLIKAMQEQQEQIKVLTEQIDSLKNQMK